jgi:hypothetical protein
MSAHCCASAVKIRVQQMDWLFGIDMGIYFDPDAV